MGLKDRLAANAEAKAAANFSIPPQFQQEQETVIEIPIVSLVPWSDSQYERQPFEMYSTEDMAALAENIAEQGVLVPVIVRAGAAPGNYQIIAGHNRTEAAKLAGLVTVPAIIKQLDDAAAREVMVYTNVHQRRELKPSELAWAYRIALEARRQQGRRTDLSGGTSGQVVQRLTTVEQMGQEYGVSGKKIQNMVRLTYLLPPLLALVDEDKIGLIAGKSLSYLAEPQQEMLLAAMADIGKKGITTEQAEDLRSFQHELDRPLLRRILKGEAVEDEVPKEKKVSFSLPAGLLRMAIPAEVKKDEGFQNYLKEAIERYLEEWTGQ